MALGAAGHFIHYFGFAMAIGASIAASKAHALARTQEAASKSASEIVAGDILTKVNLPGLFVALFGGIILIVTNPMVLSPANSGAGPWLHIKLLLVLGLFVVAHLRMFRAKRLVRERAAGASEADCDALLQKAQMFGKVDLVLTGAIFFIATFRFVLFA